MRFSSTVSEGKMSRVCGTKPRPRAARWCGARPARSSPSKTMRPRVSCANPITADSVVVLPTPLRPISASFSPGAMCRLRPFSTVTAP